MTGRAQGEGGSLVRRAMLSVTDHIRANAMRAGDVLPGEAWFAESLGVSKAVMREAFGGLGALNLVDVGNGRKPRVATVDGSVFARSLSHAVATAQVSVAEVWDVRRTIEVRTAALAAQERTAEQAERLTALAALMAASTDDLPNMTRHDIAFHQTIAQASGNGLFVQIVSSFAPLMEKAVPAAWQTRTTERQRRTMIAKHEAIAKAISVRDADAAAAAMEAHFDASIGDILRAGATSTADYS